MDIIKFLGKNLNEELVKKSIENVKKNRDIKLKRLGIGFISMETITADSSSCCEKVERKSLKNTFNRTPLS